MYGIRWSIPLEGPVRHEPIRRPFRLNFHRRLTEGERFGLSKDIGQQQLVMTAERIERLVKGNEVRWKESGPLMDELIKGMLAVGARLSPVHRPRVIGHVGSIDCHVFTIALHRQLLKVGGKSF